MQYLRTFTLYDKVKDRRNKTTKYSKYLVKVYFLMRAIIHYDSKDFIFLKDIP